ncbi:dTDP-4-dehydrorhamnose reductase [Treponema sp. TIM-1]|uniref:dTDP-4-dehydrorhamnose reductase n=1 Tax=Treponema sp. TIM-1 TaxID=2898417 RepID=UPI00397F1AFD
MAGFFCRGYGPVIWLIGSGGMLGTELSRVFAEAGMAYTGTDLEVDITQGASLEDFAEQRGPFRWIVNCAAYTAVDKAEEEAALCRRLNADGPAHIAALAGKTGGTLIHISTDYVFNGKGIYSGDPPERRPYREDDPPDPIGIYGRTKWEGERKVLEGTERAYIIRTAWLYGRYGKNFVTTMLDLMRKRDRLSVVRDQRGSPTWARNLAEVITAFIARGEEGRAVPYGIYHYSNQGDISWFEFAQRIYARGRDLGILTGDCRVIPCTSDEYPSRVKRPGYSVLDKTRLKEALGITIPEWDRSLEAFLKIIRGTDA